MAGCGCKKRNQPQENQTLSAQVVLGESKLQQNVEPPAPNNIPLTPEQQAQVDSILEKIKNLD